MSFDAIRRVAKKPPRAIELARMNREKPIRRKAVSEAEVARRAEPIMGMVAHGEIPMDETTAQLAGAYLQEQYKKGGHT
jgi:hypothetical protein